MLEEDIKIEHPVDDDEGVQRVTPYASFPEVERSPVIILDDDEME
jgi:hypothetical protein